MKNTDIEALRRDITSLLQIYRLDNVTGSDGYDALNYRERAVLTYVGENSSVRMADLAHILATRASTVTSVVERLIKQRLVVRKTADDRRVILVELSASGLRLYKSIVAQQVKHTEAMLEHLSALEREQLRILIAKVAAAGRESLA